jgi:hypothetical protein
VKISGSVAESGRHPSISYAILSLFRRILINPLAGFPAETAGPDKLCKERGGAVLVAQFAVQPLDDVRKTLARRFSLFDVKLNPGLV